MEKRKQTDSTDTNRFVEILNGDDSKKKQEVLIGLLYDRELVSKIPQETLEKLVIDKNLRVVKRTFLNKYIVDRLPKDAIIKALSKIPVLHLSDVLKEERVSKKLSDEELKHYVTAAIKECMQRNDTVIAAHLADNEDIMGRMPLNITAKLKVIKAEYDKENENLFGSDEELDVKSDGGERNLSLINFNITIYV